MSSRFSQPRRHTKNVKTSPWRCELTLPKFCQIVLHTSWSYCPEVMNSRRAWLFWAKNMFCFRGFSGRRSKQGHFERFLLINSRSTMPSLGSPFLTGYAGQSTHFDLWYFEIKATDAPLCGLSRVNWQKRVFHFKLMKMFSNRWLGFTVRLLRQKNPLEFAAEMGTKSTKMSTFFGLWNFQLYFELEFKCSQNSPTPQQGNGR